MLSDSRGVPVIYILFLDLARFAICTINLIKQFWSYCYKAEKQQYNENRALEYFLSNATPS